MPALPPELNRLLYHGSSHRVETVDLTKGARRRDFGRGFYTSTSRRQAERFAKIKARREQADFGFVNVFSFVWSPELKWKVFCEADAEWLLFVLRNRSFGKTPPKRLADIIIGPVADDAVGVVLNQLIIGTYGDPATYPAQRRAIELLEAENLHDQVFFATSAAVSGLTFKEAYRVTAN
jgi:hypothetical protein